MGVDILRQPVAAGTAPTPGGPIIFAGYGCWCWVIPLGGGDQHRRGLQQAIVRPARRRQAQGALARFATALGLRELTARATMDDDDFHASTSLPYTTQPLHGRGWVAGDAASFIDPQATARTDRLR
ncbi:MAG: hypothetical protein U1F68_11775 [Gammaproteobacteria bacterium]